MCIAERNALLHQPLGDVGGEREALRSQLLETVEMNRHRVDHASNSRAQDVEGVDLIEHRLLVFLEIAVIGERDALEDRKKAGQVTDEAAGLTAGQLSNVGVLLLRHDRRTRGV